MYSVERVSIQARGVYECLDCRRQALGGFESLEAYSVEGIQAKLAQRPSAHHMPVGWASYHTRDGYAYRCPEHVK